MKKAVLEAIKAHAQECYPKESCGLLVSKSRIVSYIPCENTAERADEHFRISAEAYAEAEEAGNIIAVVHSHPDASSRPSEADIASCNVSGLRWHILSWPEGEMTTIEPDKAPVPLIGRAFVHGVQDCASIIIDYYQRELGIDIGQYEREDEWWNKGGNLYLDNLPKAGFYQVDQPMDGDLILMQIRSPVPNHAAIYLEKGTLTSEKVHPMPGTILHHLHGRLSGRDVYAGGMFDEKTVSIWRHRDRPA